jgi:prepilin-type N-terminal cleavage/methylation domain-containing protein/prepilin-type processing-associated H-X9-DG protein
MSHRAFTLVELLVVISIIALLTAISFAAFGGSRRQARAIACQANIHHLLQSLLAYDNEHQMLPHGFDFRNGTRPPGGYIGSAVFEMQGWWWFHLAGVVRNKSQEGMKLLQCPSSRLEDRKLAIDPLCGKYGVNFSLCKAAASPSIRQLYKEEFTGTPRSVSSLRQPGSTLLIADSGYTLVSWWNATADPPVQYDPNHIEDTSYVPGLEINKNKFLWQGQTSDAIGGRHPNKTVNVGFADGHAALKPASELLVERAQDGRYSNTLPWQGH